MASLILVVEDDSDIRESLAALLKDEGYEVVAKCNGQEAGEWLLGTPLLPRCILLDLMMPVMDGWHFRAEQLRDATLAEIPVIVLSGAGDVRKEASALGAAGYLIKPFKLDAVLRVLQQACSDAPSSEHHHQRTPVAIDPK